MLREPGGHPVALVRRIDLLQPLADGAVQVPTTRLPDPIIKNLPVDRMTECVGADKLPAWEPLQLAWAYRARGEVVTDSLERWLVHLCGARRRGSVELIADHA